MKTIKLLLPLAFILAGCVNPITETKPVHLSSKSIARIKAAVEYDLIDPESAKFRNIRAVDVVRRDGSVVRTVCGEVNGRNRAGGYSGYEVFSTEITSSGVKLRGIDRPTDRVEVINSFYCNPALGDKWRQRSW